MSKRVSVKQLRQRILDLESQNQTLKTIVIDLAWMARRYADKRSTYAPGAYNDHVKTLLEMGISLKTGIEGTIWAEDGGGRDFDQLTDEQLTPNSPAALGEYIPLPRNTRLMKVMADILGSEEPATALRTLTQWHNAIESLQAIQENTELAEKIRPAMDLLAQIKARK